MMKARRFLAIFCTLVMLMGCVIGVTVSAYADDLAAEQEGGNAVPTEVTNEDPQNVPSEQPKEVPLVQDPVPVVEESQTQEPSTPPAVDEVQEPEPESQASASADPEPVVSESHSAQDTSEETQTPAQDASSSTQNKPSSETPQADSSESDKKQENDSSEDEQSADPAESGADGQDESTPTEGHEDNLLNEENGEQASAADENPSAVKQNAEDEETGDSDELPAEDADEADDALELKAGSELKGTIKAGEPLTVSAKAGKSGQVFMTLIKDSGKQINVSVDGTEIVFEKDTEADASGNVSTALVTLQSSSAEIILSSEEDVDFVLKMVSIENDVLSEEEAEQNEAADEEENNDSEDAAELEDEKADDLDELTAENAEAANETESLEENTEESEKTERSVTFAITFDTLNPGIGDIAHFKAEPVGFEGVDYIVTWQTGFDNENWEDTDYHDEAFDVEITEENYSLYWRVRVDEVEKEEG